MSSTVRPDAPKDVLGFREAGEPVRHSGGPWGCPLEDNNDMAIVPAGLVHQAQLHHDVERAIHKIKAARSGDIANIVYSMGTDATDDAAIFFRILLTDAASKEERLAEVTARVTTELVDAINPIEGWGLNPYFNFRSQSEQLSRRDPEWE